MAWRGPRRAHGDVVFCALSLLPLADAIPLSFISPVLTALMGAVILGERFDWRTTMALVAGFLGMLLIIGGKLGSVGFGPASSAPRPRLAQGR